MRAVAEIKFVGQTYRNASVGFLLAALVLTLPCVVSAQTTKIAFHRNLNFSTDIYLMNPDGSSPVNLTNTGERNENPSFSPDGSKIAFDSARDGNREIYLMNADGSNPDNLTDNPANDFDPAFSPDGSKIVFTSFRDGNYEIYIMNADGSGQTNLTSNAAWEFNPSFSPDGSKIVFESDRISRGFYDLYVMDAVLGAPQTNLTMSSGDETTPSFSPDGSQIAFASRDSGGDWEIFVMNAVPGSPRTQLTFNNDGDFYPSFSPDGLQIAFESDRNFVDGNIEIYVMNADGSGQTRLTNNPGHDSSPAWGIIFEPTPDTDGDGVPDATDNCPLTANPDQANTDGDLEGDACDADDDNDGQTDADETACGSDPLDVNSRAADNDADNSPDCVDADDDNDAVADPTDNCQFAANADQTDTDGDAQGDACDADDDNDGVADTADNCPLVSNPNQADADNDGIGDACDNTAPVANNDAFVTGEDAPLNIAAPGVLSNDTDAQMNILTAIVVSAPANAASFTFNANGSFSYTPAANFYGTDSFTYKAADAEFDSNIAVVSITVNAVNDAPTISGATVTREQGIAGTSSTIADVSDVDNAAGSLTVTPTSLPPGISLTGIINSNGTVAATVAANCNAAPGNYSVGLQVSDGNLTATANLTVNVTLGTDTDGDGRSDACDSCPSVSNPEKIVFAVGNNDNSEIYVMNADGSNKIRLTNNSVYDGEPAFSPDGSKIAFTSSRDNSFDKEIYVMNADGSNPRNLTNDTINNGVFWDVEPAFSPDGSKIVFSSTRADNGPYPTNIWVMNVDGTNKTKLTNNNPQSPYDPTFSPDGSKIAFVAYNSGFADIYVMNSDGTNQRRLTNNTAAESSPVFSPDGSKIAFSSGSFGSGGGFGGEIYVMNADGTNPLNITNRPEDDISPTFSPNGLKIAFSSRRGNTYDIYVMIADGTNQVRAANTPLVNDFAPSWGRQTAGCDANAAPVANNDAYLANEDTRLEVAYPGVRANDTDVENSVLLATLVSGPAHAAAFTLYADGSFSYTPAANFYGTDSFTYIVSDGSLQSSPATVWLTVNSVNDNPDAIADTVNILEDSGANTINVLANDRIAPDVGETLKVTFVSQGANGSTAITRGGTGVSYTPNLNFNGVDSFSYYIIDGNGGVDIGIVNVNVTPVNDAPTLTVGGSGQCLSDNSGRITVFVSDIDSSLSSLTLTAGSSNTVLVPVSNIVFGGTDAQRTATMTTGFPTSEGAASVTLTVSDGQLSASVIVGVRAGGYSNHLLHGTAGADILFGLNGNDRMLGYGGNDLLCGGQGNDVMTGGAGADSFDGGAGSADIVSDFDIDEGDTKTGVP